MPAPKGGRKQGGRRSEFDSETDLVVTRNHPVGVFAGLELSEEQRAMLTESSDYFLFDGQVEVADRTARLYSVLRRKGGRVDVLARGSGSL